MKTYASKKWAVFGCALLGFLFLIGGAAALASHFMLRPVASDAELGSLSSGLLATGLGYWILMALCFLSARALAKHTRKAIPAAAMTVSLVGVAECWSLYRDVQTGVSASGVIEFVVVGILLAVISTPCFGQNMKPWFST